MKKEKTSLSCEKYFNMKKHIGMFVRSVSYQEVSALLTGMSYMSEEDFLEGFHEWLCAQFNIFSSFAWDVLVENLYYNKYLDTYENLNRTLLLKLQEKHKTDVDFLFNLVDSFLFSKGALDEEDELDKIEKEILANMKVLSPNDSIHERPFMYIGTASQYAFVSLLKDVLGEFIVGQNTENISIKFDTPSKGKLTFEANNHTLLDAFAYLEEDPKKVSLTSVHILNSLSRFFTVEFTDKNGNLINEQSYEKGILKKGEVNHVELEYGYVAIIFELDAIWKPTKWTQDYATNPLREYAYLHKDTKFTLEYKLNKELCRVVYAFKNGLEDKLYHEQFFHPYTPYFKTSLNEKIDDFEITGTLLFNEYDFEHNVIYSYVNDIYTYHNGTHVKAILRGLKYAIQRYIDRYKSNEESTYNVSLEEIEQYLVLMVQIKMKTPKFSSFRDRLMNRYIIQPIEDHIADKFLALMEEERVLADKFLCRFKVYDD